MGRKSKVHHHPPVCRQGVCLISGGKTFQVMRRKTDGLRLDRESEKGFFSLFLFTLLLRGSLRGKQAQLSRFSLRFIESIIIRFLPLGALDGLNVDLV